MIDYNVQLRGFVLFWIRSNSKVNELFSKKNAKQLFGKHHELPKSLNYKLRRAFVRLRLILESLRNPQVNELPSDKKHREDDLNK